MALLHYLWSRVAASNSNADSAINWAEGQSPSSVNDSARAMMASAAGFRDDIAGAIVTGGTSTAYTVTSYQVFDTLAHMSGQMIAFTPHVTNGATVTLNVDGLGAKPLRPAPSVELQSNVLILGTPYVALYNNSDAVWYLQGMGSNTYGMPLAGGMDFWGTTAPSSAYAFPAGQAISRTTYATLFSIMSTTYGSGDGSTTFNLPDKTGRVSAMKEASATRLTTAVGGVDGATMGSAAGVQSRTVAQANLPNVNLSTSSVTATLFYSSPASGQSGSNYSPVTNVSGNNPGGYATTSLGLSGSVPLGGSGTALPTVQPTIVCNYIIRVI
jgi:microcystin-dependent protein